MMTGTAVLEPVVDLVHVAKSIAGVVAHGSRWPKTDCLLRNCEFGKPDIE